MTASGPAPATSGPCRDCGRPFSPDHDSSAPGPTVRHPFMAAHPFAAPATSGQRETSEQWPPEVRVLVNTNIKMSRHKAAAQAVHAALYAFGIDHGRVVVLGARPDEVAAMDTVIRDRGLTEVEPFTLTAGASVERALIGHSVTDQPPAPIRRETVEEALERTYFAATGEDCPYQVSTDGGAS